MGAGSKGTLGELSNTSGVLNNPLTSFLSDPDRSYTSGKPKAYLNWILLDEQQFKYVDINNNSGAVQIPAIGGSEQKKLLEANGGADITIAKNGYIYVFVSNESQGAVYFDDLRIEHTPGAILEETHYYPFGLTMAGISSRAAGSLKNNYGITNKEKQSREFSDGTGLDMYDFGFRMQDPQIGRWWQIDPLADKNHTTSPYVYCANNPINYVDPDGRDAILTITKDDEGNWHIKISATYYVTGKDANKKWIESEVIGLNNMLKQTFADKTTDNGDGSTTSITFDLTAKYKENISDKDLKEGENIIEINNSDQPKKGNGRMVWDKRDKTPEENPINKNDRIHTRHSYVNSYDWIRVIIIWYLHIMQTGVSME